MASAVVVASATSSPTSTTTTATATTTESTSPVATTRNNNDDEHDYDHDQNQDNTTAATTHTLPTGDIITSNSTGSPDSVNNNGVLTTYENASNDIDINSSSSNHRHHRQLLLEEEEERSLLNQKSHSITTIKAEETILSSSSSPSPSPSSSLLFVAKNDCSEIQEGTVPSHPTSTTSNKSFGEGPLPRELRRIIQEVAKTGACSWLSWSQETTTSASSCRRGGEVTTTRTSTTANSSNSNNRSPSHDYAAAAAGSTSSLTKAGIAAAAAAAAATGSSSSSQYSLSLTMKNVNGHTNSNGSSNNNNKRQFSGTGGGGGGGTSRRSTSAPPTRKKHRNGMIHKKGGERMRFGNLDGAFGRNSSNSSSTSSSSRKRPLGHVRTTNSASSSSSGGNNNNNNNNNNSNCSSSNNNNNNNNNNNDNNNNNTYNNTVNGTLFSGGATTLGGLYSSAPSSVGSGRSTGSEPDYDSTQYECDSEGTSATTNSEISVRKTTRAKRSGASNTPGETQINNGPEDDALTATMGDYGEDDDDDDDDEMNSIDDNNTIPGSPYKNLQTAFRVALGLVLDHFYHNRNNGYKLSPAEKRRNDRLAETVNNNANSSNNNNGTNKDSTMTNGEKLSSLLSSEHVFQQRRQRLMAMLLPVATSHLEDGQQRRQRLEKISDDPPFTVQRIAEVLVAPDRYYTQTHKLCNCLEKLLLVISSTNAFGGSTGGDTSQRRREEGELAALADEKGRQESKLRQRRLRKRNSSPIDELVAKETTDSSSSVSTEHGMKEDTIIRDSENKLRSFPVKNDNEDEAMIANESSTSPEQKHRVGGSSNSTSRVMLEALARASLRTKFDHVGVEPIPSNMNEREIQKLVENRSMTNSPPPLNLNLAASGPNIAFPNHAGGGVNGYVRQHQHISEQQQNTDHNAVARATSPILFSSSNDANLETATNLHMLQLHHAVALSGVSLNRSNPSPLELMTIDASTISQIRSQSNATGAGGSGSTDGRSSASNSDVDSESDDMFDDSASDRSDGSDSGSTTHHEPFTAARAMALNRMQQQQRLQQSRVLTSLGSSHQSEGFRPPGDSEYQSGDSIDSMRCEDSGGSDSSVSSDFAD